jgi:hypothetical protein
MRLEQFYSKLEREWAGSLVKVQSLRHAYAKEYLHQLVRDGRVERVAWGWYWIPAPLNDAWDFLARDRNPKVVSGQSAASVWNGDFVHRDVIVVSVSDASYAKALKAFGESRGWAFEVEVSPETPYSMVDGLAVEPVGETVADCMRRWAFTDALAVLHVHPEIDVRAMTRQHYWRRLPGTDMRIGPVIEYGTAKLEGRKARSLKDGYVQREVDEAVEKVLELA